MQTIRTEYLGPTYTKGARIKASCDGGSGTLSYDYSLNSEDMHIKAAKALKDQMGWKGRMIGGHTDKGMVFVFDNALYVVED